MKRKLVFDPAFQPIRFTGENSEKEFFRNGIFLFDIAALNEHICAHQGEYSVVTIQVADFYSEDDSSDSKENLDSFLYTATENKYGSGFSNLKKEHIEAADLTRPVILFEIAPDRLSILSDSDQNNYNSRGYNLVDGHHRIVKAYRLGYNEIKAYLVRMEQHLPFMFEGYKEYVEYWNGKLKDLAIWENKGMSVNR